MTRKLNANEFHRITADNEFVTKIHKKRNEIQQSRNPFTKKYLKNKNKNSNLSIALMSDVDSV